MKLDDIVKRARKFSRPYRITEGEKFRLKDIDPGDTAGLGAEDKARAKEILQIGVEGLARCKTCCPRARLLEGLHGGL